MDTNTSAVDPRHVSYTHLMYALHAFAVISGILTAATIVGQFIFGLPSIIAVIMNYARREQVRGTWLATHFSWQLRTFWWAFAWVAGIWLTFGALALLLIGIPFMIAGYVLVGLWVAYRVGRGWLALRDGRAMPIIPL
jgi:uncharacterized membrane protein